MATQTAHYVTVDEYLKQEETAVERHQYWNGEIFAMSGGTPNHSLLISNIIAALTATDCLVRDSNMGIKTADGLYTYPDVVISCTPEKFVKNFLTNPVVIIEVLSDSTEAYDRGRKFEKYRQIESFREYLMVAQDRIHVEHFIRSGALDSPVWKMREFNSVSDEISMDAAKAILPLRLIYSKVTLDPAENQVSA